MSDLKKLGRNPLEKTKPIRKSQVIEKVIDKGPVSLGPFEKIKSMKIELDLEEFVESAVKEPLKKWSQFLRNFQ